MISPETAIYLVQSKIIVNEDRVRDKLAIEA